MEKWMEKKSTESKGVEYNNKTRAYQTKNLNNQGEASEKSPFVQAPSNTQEHLAK